MDVQHRGYFCFTKCLLKPKRKMQKLKERYKLEPQENTEG